MFIVFCPRGQLIPPYFFEGQLHCVMWYTPRGISINLGILYFMYLGDLLPLVMSEKFPGYDNLAAD